MNTDEMDRVSAVVRTADVSTMAFELGAQTMKRHIAESKLEEIKEIIMDADKHMIRADIAAILDK